MLLSKLNERNFHVLRSDITRIDIADRRLESEPWSENESEGEREEGGRSLSSGEPIRYQSDERQCNREHTDRDQGPLGRHQLSRGVCTYDVQGTLVRSLRQL